MSRDGRNSAQNILVDGFAKGSWHMSASGDLHINTERVPLADTLEPGNVANRVLDGSHPMSAERSLRAMCRRRFTVLTTVQMVHDKSMPTKHTALRKLARYGPLQLCKKASGAQRRTHCPSIR